MITVETIPYMGYALAFMSHRSVYSDRCAAEASRCGELIAAKIDGRFVGFLCAVAEVHILRVTYAYTRPEYRGRGVFTALMTDLAGNRNCNLRVNIVSDNEFRDIVVKVCDKLGFTRGEDLAVYKYFPQTDTAWEEFMSERGNRMCEMLRRHGYSTVSFAEADEDILRQVRESDISEFCNPFVTRPFFDEPERRMTREMSFAAVKDGKLAAYTLGTLPSENKAVLEQIAVSKKKRGTGVILLPFAETLRAFRASSCLFAAYAIYESNLPANAFRDKLVSIGSRKVSENYYLYIGQGEKLADEKVAPGNTV
ncbi:MAG: GNAT family N-acetyltransferase [Ruminiclostridium sp.]|nr:GNAT family N-acetyltransferase [Ruminiclostridium sp.]